MNNWTRRPSERYDREDYYRHDIPDHYTTENEEGRWHFAGKFEDRNDPTYSYASRERDTMREYPTYPLNEEDFYQRHPDRRRNNEPSYAGRGPKGWKRSDESIKETICHALEQHPRVDASEIEVEVQNGVVTLKGSIHDRAAKRRVSDLVDWLPGVEDVHNNLVVDKSFFQRAKELLTGESH